MRRFIITLTALICMTATASAQRIADIMGEARYITDKMAVELALTKAQSNSILQLNIAYLNGINSYRDIDASGWKQRNRHIKALLNDKQWRMYKKANWFYRPIGWQGGDYVHYIYAKYPQKTGRPACGKGPGPRKQPHFGSGRGGNNSPEAIKMRRDMRKGMKHGAR